MTIGENKNLKRLGEQKKCGGWRKNMGENTMKVAFGLNFVHFDFTHQIVFMSVLILTNTGDMLDLIF